MAGKNAWTPEEDALLRELLSRPGGATVREAARIIGRAYPSVYNRSEILGLSWTPVDTHDQTRAARERRSEVARQRRSRLIDQLEQDAERIAASLFEQTKVYNFGGKDNTFAEETIDEPSHADKLKIAQTMQTLVGTIERLQKMDADTQAADAAGMLDGIASALTAAAEHVRAGTRPPGPADDADGEELL